MSDGERELRQNAAFLRLQTIEALVDQLRGIGDEILTLTALRLARIALREMETPCS